MSRPARTIRAAALLYLLLGVGFGAATPITLAYLARTGELPMTPFGFRALSGPFERLGTPTFSALGWGLVGVCALDVVAGAWLWRGQRRGALLGIATTPLALLLGLGFALPFLVVGIPIRVGLVVAGRRSLR